MSYWPREQKTFTKNCRDLQTSVRLNWNSWNQVSGRTLRYEICRLGVLISKQLHEKKVAVLQGFMLDKIMCTIWHRQYSVI